MPFYEYRCRTCDDVFEMLRPMSAANDPADCPAGHADTVRRLSVFANLGSSTDLPAVAPAGGGCCGGGCGCGP